MANNGKIAVLVFLILNFSMTCCSLCIVPVSSSIHKHTSCDSATINHFCESSATSNNTTVNILSGTHTLNTTCEVKNVNNITLRGESQSRVVIKCSPNQESGFRFFNVTMLELSGIELSDCGASWSTAQQLDHLTPNILSALLFVNGSNLTLNNMTVSNAKAAGIYIYNVGGRVLVDSCVVVNASSYRSDVMSGNVIVHDHLATQDNQLFSIANSLIFSSGYRNDCNQNLYSSGLSLFIGSAKLTIDIVHLNLTRNKGCMGGNMAVLFFDFAPVTISDTIFSDGEDAKYLIDLAEKKVFEKFGIVLKEEVQIL